MSNWTIRRAKPSDANGLSWCFGAAYAQYAARIQDLPPVSEGWAEEIAEKLVWVATGANTLIAGLVLAPKKDFMQLVNVAVHPDYRGTGLGRRLIELAESEALKRGYDEMRLTTHTLMPENVRLYQRSGWKQVEVRGSKISLTKNLSETEGQGR